MLWANRNSSILAVGRACLLSGSRFMGQDSPGSDCCIPGRSHCGAGAGQPESDWAHHLRAGPAGSQPQHPVLHPAASWDPRLLREPLPAPAGESATLLGVCLLLLYGQPLKMCMFCLCSDLWLMEQLSKSDTAIKTCSHHSCSVLM